MQQLRFLLFIVGISGLIACASASVDSTTTRGPSPTQIPQLAVDEVAQPTSPKSTSTIELATPTQHIQVPTDIPLTSTPVAPPELKRGINLAGDFEVFPRNEWGTPIEEYFFDLAVEAGFDHVRIPIRFSTHTDPALGYGIDPAFLSEVDWLIAQAERTGLSIIINTHHFEALNEDPFGEAAHLQAIWQQVAERYASVGPHLIFEINNEPFGPVFDNQPEVWNQLIAETLPVIRSSNPDRLVIVGPVSYNHPNRLYDLELPNDDNLMVTVHTYDPIRFTVQGAPWFDPPPALGATWNPNHTVVDHSWIDNTWDSQVSATEEGLLVNFERQYAAFAVRSLIGQRGPFDQIIVKSDRQFEAIVLCDFQNEPIQVELTPIQNDENGDVVQQGAIGACGPFETIAIQLV